MQRHNHKPQSKVRSASHLMEDDIPLALLAYKKGYINKSPSPTPTSTTSSSTTRHSSHRRKKKRTHHRRPKHQMMTQQPVVVVVEKKEKRTIFHKLLTCLRKLINPYR